MDDGFVPIAPVTSRRAVAAREPKFTVRAYQGKKGIVWTGGFNRACVEAAGWEGGVDRLNVRLGPNGDVAFITGEDRSLSSSFQFQLTAYQETLKLEVGTYPVEISEGRVVVKRAGRRDLYVKPAIVSLPGTEAPAEADL